MKKSCICGLTGGLQTHQLPTTKKFIVVCHKCTRQGPERKTHRAAKEAWNRFIEDETLRLAS